MISILITSCTSQLPYLSQSIASVSDCADFVVLGYDTHGRLPSEEIIKQCDIFFSGIPKGKQPGETFSLKTGLGLVRDKSEYVFKMTGDAIIEKPEGFVLLPDLLGDDDIMTAQWNSIGSTLLFFGRSAPLFEVVKDIPEVNNPQIERRFWASLCRRKLKCKIFPMEREQGQTGNNGIWSEVLGYRHLHREIRKEGRFL